MGMFATILAVGPFSEAIVECLSYSSELYVQTRLGVPVTTELFGITEGSTASREFAAALGITDAWDFNQHKIDMGRVNFEELNRVLRGLAHGDEYVPDVRRFRVLAENGFEFYFQPNG